MNSRDINEYLQKEFSGKNTFKQDQNKQYLGILAERVKVFITKQQANNKDYQLTLNTIIQNNPGGQIKINANLDMKLRLTYMKIAQKNNIPFTIIDHESELANSNQISVIYHFNEIVTQSIQDISNLT
ncbi:DUF1694 domain-containing protein [Vagococcus xieshaowenii]|uniref:DUF1694 domain-containing protein n=1 Tax=Vagococcus xieshaowenii TaxID=2562451 RepID=A0AAJ5JMI8_9ENTE|nr:DUF1694 domain-containing protein [Vagococcus xieshaowenii]QCA28038.1 DUF1694 domain-containing protein [Vagococcus xieshaowenii]TFZ42106.1 DUF1694 domain-containing protein [Vagococcus xieshaowenii]